MNEILKFLVSFVASIVVVEILVYLISIGFMYYVSPHDNSTDKRN